MLVEIGPFSIEVAGDPDSLNALGERFRHFVVPGSGGPPFRIELSQRAPEELGAREGELWVAEPSFSLAYRKGAARASYLPMKDGATEEPLTVAFMHALSLHALDNDALLTHAAAVAPDATAWVFVGRSGAGKSTLASWFLPDAVLNDDFVLLHRDTDGRALVSSQPFFGKSMADRIARPLTTPVRALVTLGHGERAELSSVVPGEAFRALLPSIALPHSVESRRDVALRLAAHWSAERWVHLEFPLEPTTTLRALFADA